MPSHDKLRVSSPYSIESIRAFTICQSPNEHATLHLEGITAEKSAFNPVMQATLKNEIHVYLDEDSEKKTLFRGRISNVTQDGSGDVFSIKLDAIAATSELDIVKKRRTFQNPSMTYGELIQAIIKDYPHVQIHDSIDDKRLIPVPVVQYDETDWEFLKRMASHFHTVLYSSCEQNVPLVWFGLPVARNRYELNPMFYSSKKDLTAYRSAAADGAALADTDFYSYNVQEEGLYALGDTVQINGREMFVVERKIVLEQAVVMYRYTLGRQGYVYCLKQCNLSYTGLQLEGAVLATQGEVLKVHFDIDENQSIEEACWISYAPPTGSLMYCMPKLGTKVNVYISDEDEISSIAIGCIRTNSDDCIKIEYPSVRYLGTEHGSEMMLSPGMLRFTDAPNSNCNAISTSDHKGVNFSSTTTLTLETSRDINIKAHESVIIATNKEVLTNSFIGGLCNLSDETNHKGARVKMDGTTKELKSKVVGVELVGGKRATTKATAAPSQKSKKSTKKSSKKSTKSDLKNQAKGQGLKGARYSSDG